MANWLIIIGISIAALGFFVLAMSLTLLIKGHHIDSEISTNKDMKRLGIQCAVHETRRDDGTSACSGNTAAIGCSGNCAGCDIEEAQAKAKKGA